MAHTLEPISDALGALRKGLVSQGFSEDQAFQILVDLIRRGDNPFALLREVG